MLWSLKIPVGVRYMSNIVTEYETVASSRYRDYFYIVPEQGPFYIEGFEASINVNGNVRQLVEDLDFSFALEYIAATRTYGKVVYGAITLHNLEMDGVITYTYKKVEGLPTTNRLNILVKLAEMAYNPRITTWDVVTDYPDFLPPAPHHQDYDTLFGQNAVIDELRAIATAIANRTTTTRLELQSFLDAMGLNDVTRLVHRSGDSMTGPLNLNQDPYENTHAVRKSYVDTTFATKDYVQSEVSNLTDPGGTLSNVLLTTGGYMTGYLHLHEDPVADNQASTKRYVDLKLGYLTLTLQGLENRINALEASNLANRVSSLENNTFTKEEVLRLIGEVTAMYATNGTH